MKTFKITSTGDLFISPSGRPVYVEGRTKLNQDVEKALQTHRNPSDTKRPDANYGSDLMSIIGTGQSTPTKTRNLVANAIRSSLTALKNIQTETYNNLKNKLSFPKNERIWGIEGIQVIINPSEPREINWKLIIIDQEGVDSQSSRSVVNGVTKVG